MINESRRRRQSPRSWLFNQDDGNGVQHFRLLSIIARNVPSGRIIMSPEYDSSGGKKKKPILIRSAECSTSKEEKLTTHTTHGKKKLKDPRSSPHEEIKDLTGRRCAIFEIKANGASQREVEDSIKRFISPDGRVCVCVCVIHRWGKPTKDVH